MDSISIEFTFWVIKKDKVGFFCLFGGMLFVFVLFFCWYREMRQLWIAVCVAGVELPEGHNSLEFKLKIPQG